jgi:acetyltransferase-like isoleucine patch superfamily enzyme
VKRLLVRMIRAPRRVGRGIADRLIAPAWLRLLGVQFEVGCRFYGLPEVSLGPGGRIVLGERVKLYSRRDTNPRGVVYPTILHTRGKETLIEIQADTDITGASIVAWKEIRIGRNVLIGPGVCIWDHDGHPIESAARRNRTDVGAIAPIRIEDDVFIGAHASILKGVTVGRAAVVGTKAVVAKNVAPGEIVVGNPARVVGRTS